MTDLLIQLSRLITRPSRLSDHKSGHFKMIIKCPLHLSQISKIRSKLKNRLFPVQLPFVQQCPMKRVNLVVILVRFVVHFPNSPFLAASPAARTRYCQTCPLPRFSIEGSCTRESPSWRFFLAFSEFWKIEARKRRKSLNLTLEKCLTVVLWCSISRKPVVRQNS